MKKFNEFLNESKVASDESPYGYYTIANAIPAKDFVNELDNLGIKWTFDWYSNFIKVFTDKGELVRKLVLSDLLEADDIDNRDMPYIIEDGPNDMLEIAKI